MAEEEADGGGDDAAAADVAGGGGASSSVAELSCFSRRWGRARGRRRGSSSSPSPSAPATAAAPSSRPRSPSAPIRRRGRRGCSRARAAASQRAGLPALHEAARAGHTPLVARLLGARAPPTLLSSGGVPPLHLAAEQPAALDALDALLGGGALAMRDGRRQTALHSAARAGNVAAIGRLLAAAAADPPGRERSAGGCREPFIELRDRWHRTALHWAVVNGEAAAAAALVAAGAAVNGVPMSVGKHLKATSLPLEAPIHSAARPLARRGAPSSASSSTRAPTRRRATSSARPRSPSSPPPSTPTTPTPRRCARY